MSSNLPSKSHDEYNKLKQMAIDEHESRHRQQIMDRMKSIEESFTNALTMIQDNTLSVPNYPDEFIQTSLQYIRNEWKGPTLNQQQLNDKQKMNVKYFKDNIGNWICRHAKDISYPCILKYIQILRESLMEFCQNDDKAFRYIWYNFWKQILDANINCNNTKLEVIPGGLLFKYKDIRDELQKHLFQKFSGYIVNLENMKKNCDTKQYKLKIIEKVNQLSTLLTTNYQPPTQQHPEETKFDDNPPPPRPTITNQFRSDSTSALGAYITPNTTDAVYTRTHLTSVAINNRQNSNFIRYRHDGALYSNNITIDQTQSAVYLQTEQSVSIQSEQRQPSMISAMSHQHNNHNGTSANHSIETSSTYCLNSTQHSQETEWSNSNITAHSNVFSPNLDLFRPTENVPSHSANPYPFRSSITEQSPQPQHLCNNPHLRPPIRYNEAYNNTLITNPNGNFHSNNTGVYQTRPSEYVQDVPEEKTPAQSEIITQYGQPVITTTPYSHNNHHQLMADTTCLNSNNFAHFYASIDENGNLCHHDDPSMLEIAEQPTCDAIYDPNIPQIQHSYGHMDTNNNPFQIQHSHHEPNLPIGYNPLHNPNYNTSSNRYTPY